MSISNADKDSNFHYTPTSDRSPKASKIPNDKVVINCTHCSRKIPLGSILSSLSLIKLSKNGKSLIRSESLSLKSKISPESSQVNNLCVESFQKYLQKLTNSNQLCVQQKIKKIKKRGRKKWIARHDLILEGCVLLWGDDVHKIMRLLPEFNENVIKRKLGHVLWKNYLVVPETETAAKEQTFKKRCSLESDNRAIIQQLNDDNWSENDRDMAFETPNAKTESDPLVNCFGAVPTISELNTGDKLDAPMTIQTNDISPADFFKSQKRDAVNLIQTKKVISPLFPLHHQLMTGNSIAELSRLLSDNSNQSRESQMSIGYDARRDIGLYRNSLADIFSYERQNE